MSGDEAGGPQPRTIPTLFAALALCAPASPAPAKPAGAKVQMMGPPLSFDTNRGQFDPRMRYMTRTGGATVLLADSESAMVLPGKPIVGPAKPDPMDPMARMPYGMGRMGRPKPPRRGPGAVLRMKVVGARKAPPVAGAQKLPGIVNHFCGNDPMKWRTSISTDRQVRYAGIYPGTDLV